MAVGTGAITMLEVQAEMATSPTTLTAMVARANATNGWDATYSGSKNSLANFRGYTEAVLTLSPSSVSVASIFNTTTLTVVSNTTWTAVSNQAWAVVSGASGSGNDTFVVGSAFNTGAARSATITVSGGGITRTCVVNQAAGSVANTLNRSPTSLSFTQSAQTLTFSVTSNTTWSVSDNRSWISTSGADGSGNDSSVNCTVSTNNTGNTRTGRVTISTTSGSPSISRTITITQNGNPI